MGQSIMDSGTRTHPYTPADSFDGGDLDCGNGLLLLIRKHIDPLTPGQLLEILSTETSVVEDLPAWCRLTGNDLVSHISRGKQNSFLVSKGPAADLRAAEPEAAPPKRKKRRNIVQRAKRNTRRLPSPSPRS